MVIPLRTSCGLQRGLHGLRAMSASASAKKTQGELVEDALQQYGDTSSLDLIDIGINLADPSFDQVGPPPTNVISHELMLLSKQIWHCEAWQPAFLWGQ